MKWKTAHKMENLEEIEKAFIKDGNIKKAAALNFVRSKGPIALMMLVLHGKANMDDGMSATEIAQAILKITKEK